jgi:3-hydroxyacyl-CoA dehydrogenase
MASETVKLVRDNGIGFVLIDNPPVNASSQAVRAGLMASMDEAFDDPAITAIVLACEGRTFMAGADIREFGKPPLSPLLTDVVNLIENGAKPVVAAIHGTALGGGFELALACHARVMARQAKIGLPEVKLGLLPGAGGTQRTPRLAGMLAALDLVTTGRPVRAEEAHKLGLADIVTDGDLHRVAAEHARSLVGRPLRRTGALPVPAFDATTFEKARAAVAAKARGQISPLKAAEAVALAATLPLAEGMARERAMFLDLVPTPQARALRHVFFAEREVARVPRLKDVAPRPFETIGMIGAGTMGAGIAVSFLDARRKVIVVENSMDSAAAGRARIAALYDRAIKSGRMSEAQKAERLSLLTIAARFDALAECDLIVEAIFEDMAVKKDVFARLGPIAKAGAVLATNTSYLDINEIANASGRAADVIGLHFFSPANVMKLVEVVETGTSAPDAVVTGMAVAQALGKIGVGCGVCDGFIGNRIMSAWRYQTDSALEDGAFPHEIDAALEAFGLPMGPFAVGDLSGLDISRARRKRLEPTRDPRLRYVNTLADRLCDMGRLGQKTGGGWYRYDGNKRQIDPEVIAMIEAYWKEKGTRRTPLDGNALVRRVRAVMVNEGAKILAEGIAARPLDIDIVKINGYGYPAWRGGPMFEADEIGTSRVLEDMKDVHLRSGFGSEPASLLVELAARDGKFQDWLP